MLIADDIPEEVPRSLAGERRRLDLGGAELGGAELGFGLLVVGSVEERWRRSRSTRRSRCASSACDLTLRASARHFAAAAAGDVRAAVYAACEEGDREYVPLAGAAALIAAGRTRVAAAFVVPYPPGFPVLVPGQVISPEILTFLTRLDIKEVHGYRAELGLCVFSERSPRRLAAGHNRRRQ